MTSQPALAHNPSPGDTGPVGNPEDYELGGWELSYDLPRIQPIPYRYQLALAALAGVVLAVALDRKGEGRP